jgi:hypothetical protein
VFIKTIHPTSFHAFTMAGNEDTFSSPLFVPQDSPGLGVGSIDDPDTLFEDLDLSIPLEAPDVDMDQIDDLENFGNPEPKPAKAGRSIFRLPVAGHTFLVGTQQQPQSPPQASVEVELGEDVEVRAEPVVGRDVSFNSPSTLSSLAAFDFDLDADVFSFGGSHSNTEVELPGQDLPFAQPHEDLSVAQPHVTREEESEEVFPSFATDIGQLEFTFGQLDPHSDFATEANQRQFLIDQKNRDEGREVREESPFSAQYTFGSPLPSLQPMPEDQAPAIEREQANSALLPLSLQIPFDTPSNVQSLKSESEHSPAPASAIEREQAYQVLSPPTSQNTIDLPSLKPESEEQAAPAPTIKREPPSSTISPFTSRAECARRAKLNAIKSEVSSDQEPADISSMATPQAASARTRLAASKEDADMNEAIILSTAAKENTEMKESTLPSAAAFTQAARTRERSGTTFGIKPKENSATIGTATSPQAETAIDKAFSKLISPDRATVPAASTPTRAQRRNKERNTRRDGRRNNDSNNGNNGNNTTPGNVLDQLSNPLSTTRATTNFSNPSREPTPLASFPTAESILVAAFKHLESQAQKYRNLENDACDREEELADRWTLARQLRVKAIEERRNALVLIRYRHRQLAALQGMSDTEIVEGGLVGVLEPFFLEDGAFAGTEEFERMVVEGEEAGGMEDDGYETPPFGD